MPKKTVFSIVLLMATTIAINAQQVYPITSQDRTREKFALASRKLEVYKPFQDVRFMSFDDSRKLDSREISLLTFNRLTRWSIEASTIAEQILAKFSYPGLGLKGIHDSGITGRGVNVAIIDQNLAGDHPEFRGKIKEYYDLGCDKSPDSGSMHGPAVVSLLVGDNIGTAPGSGIYYFAVPSWKKDAKYYADALDMIIGINKGLSQKDKIRVVSVSAAPSGKGTPFEKNNKTWEVAVKKAKKANLLILDCTSTHGFILPGYADQENLDNLEAFRSGWPDRKPSVTPSDCICAPCSFRTIAEEYVKDEYSYQYTCNGGLSWAIPYVAGVCALAWQVNPNISADQMRTFLLKSAYITKEKARVIYPQAVVDSAKKYSGK